ncbi:MAG: M17 family peptidase N-terminal domain-containing protein [Desulfomonilia bacterium]
MEVHVDTRDPFDVDVAVLGLWFFSDERPLKGLTGLLDWRLEARISQLIISGFMTGEYGEKAMVGPFTAYADRVLILVGLGRLTELIPERIRDAGEIMARTALGLCREDMCMSLPGNGIKGVNIVSIAEHILAGLARTIGQRRFLLRVLCTPEDVDEAILGFQKTKVSMKSSFHTKIVQVKP